METFRIYGSKERGQEREVKALGVIRRENYRLRMENNK